MPRSPRITVYKKRRRWTATDARAVLSALAASGLSTSAYATREGLGVERLYRWRQRLGQKRSAAPVRPTFLELTPRATASIEVVLRSGRVLRVPESIDATALLRLIEVLEQPASC